MRVAAAFKSETVAHLPTDQRALYALASGNVSEELRDGFVARAEAGERVTHAMATPAP